MQTNWPKRTGSFNSSVHTVQQDNIEINIVSMLGKRSTMEDKYTISTKLSNHPDFHLYAVLDGHSGENIVEYATKYISDYINSLESFDDISIKDTFIKLDKDMKAEFLKNEPSGSTCVMLLLNVKDKNCIVAHIGDSPAFILKKDGNHIILTKNHKPLVEEEKNRIEKAKHTVTTEGVNKNRIDNKLNISRAFGDYAYKDNCNLIWEEQAVIPVPDINRFVLTEQDIIFLSSDGLFEGGALKTLKIAIRCLGNIIENENSNLFALRKITYDVCRCNRSKDNITGMLINLTDDNNSIDDYNFVDHINQQNDLSNVY